MALGLACVAAFRNTFLSVVPNHADVFDDWAIALAVGILSVAVAFAHKQLSHPLERNVVFLGLSGIGLLGFAVLFMVELTGSANAACYYACILLVAFYFTIATLCWLIWYAKLSLARVLVVYAVSQFLFYGLGFVVGLLPGFAAVCLVVLMPFVSIACYWKKPVLNDGEEVQYSENKPRVPYKPLVLVFAVSFVQAGLTNSNSSTLAPYFAFPGACIVALAIGIYVAVKHDRLSLTPIYQAVLPLMALGILCMLFRTPLADMLGLLACDAGWMGMVILLTAVFCSICYRYGIDALWLLGLLRGGIAFSRAFALYLIEYQSLIEFRTSTLFCVAATIVLIVLHQSLVAGHDFQSSWGIIPDVDASFASTAQVDFFLSRKYGLTRREEEVLDMLAQDFTTTQISERMFVSEATVRTHIQHIYRKLDIHSRAELRAIVASA